MEELNRSFIVEDWENDNNFRDQHVTHLQAQFTATQNT